MGQNVKKSIKALLDTRGDEALVHSNMGSPYCFNPWFTLILSDYLDPLVWVTQCRDSSWHPDSGVKNVVLAVIRTQQFLDQKKTLLWNYRGFKLDLLSAQYQYFLIDSISIILFQMCTISIFPKRFNINYTISILINNSKVPLSISMSISINWLPCQYQYFN